MRVARCFGANQPVRISLPNRSLASGSSGSSAKASTSSWNSRAGLFLHNHLLMRGTWKKLEGQQLFLPPNAWIALYVGPYTICNLGGQMLKVVTKGDVDEQLASLGPDAMD